MASGTIYTAEWTDGWKPWRVAFDWTSTPDIATNTSKIDWTLRVDTESQYTVVISELSVTFDGASIYYRDDGEHTNATKNTVFATGTTTVQHNSDGTKSLACAVGAGIYNHAINRRGSGTIVLDNIPRFASIISAPDFSDEANPTITYSNPAGNAIERLYAIISLDGSSNDIARDDILPTGTSYTFSLTEAERNLLRNATTTANSRSVIFRISSAISQEWQNSDLSRTLSIVNANPTISPSVTDANAATVALTGNSGIMVRYASNAQISIGAAALKGASIVAQRVTNGGQSLTADGIIYAVESGTFTFVAQDSRGNTTTVTAALPLVEYVKLTNAIGNNMPDTYGNMTVTASGNCFNGSFGGVSNTLAVYYRYKVQGGSYGDWTAMALSWSGNAYTATAAISGLDYQTSYVFQTAAADALSWVESGERNVKATPVFDFSKEDFRFYVPARDKDGVTLGGGTVNPNLLDNWYFDNPINQRGQTTYHGEIYTIDRWTGKWTGDGSTTVNAADGTVDIVRPAYQAHFLQKIEAEGLVGMTVTCSVMARHAGTVESAGNIYVYCVNENDETIQYDATMIPPTTNYVVVWLTVRIPAGTKQIWFDIASASYSGVALKIKAAKLEPGDSQTLGHQDADGNWVLNEIPYYGEQLAKCLRYFFTADSNKIFCFPGVSIVENTIDVTFPVPVTMRTLPGVEALAYGFREASTTPTVLSIIGVSEMMPGYVRIRLSWSGLPMFSTATVQFNGITLSADL